MAFVPNNRDQKFDKIKCYRNSLEWKHTVDTSLLARMDDKWSITLCSKPAAELGIKGANFLHAIFRSFLPLLPRFVMRFPIWKVRCSCCKHFGEEVIRQEERPHP